ncbi:MAG: MFS transporter [Alphaproteobacteria bacterium]
MILHRVGCFQMMVKATKETSSTNSASSAMEIKGFPLTIWILGLMMFLINLSFVMVYSFSGLYLKSFLGVSTVWIGILEGAAEASSYAMKLFSGVFSDSLKKRKPVMVLGYFLSVFSRPLIAVADSFSLVFASRLMERFGNGIQATPRDAMVADIAHKKRIGASFGLKRSLGTAGSFFGAVCGYFAMKYTNDYHTVFWLSTIPAFIAFAVLIFFVKEPKKAVSSSLSSALEENAVSKNKKRFTLKNFRFLGKTFWILMLINAVFMLARVNETFLILYSYGHFALAKEYAPTVMMAFNIGWCVSSFPVGVIADRVNRYWFLAIGIILLILSDLVLAIAPSKLFFFLGVFLWGVQYGMTQNVFVSLITEIVPAHLRGTGFGCYYIITALSAFCADSIAGKISHHHGEMYAFVASGIVASASLLLFLSLMGRSKSILSINGDSK